MRGHVLGKSASVSCESINRLDENGNRYHLQGPVPGFVEDLRAGELALRNIRKLQAGASKSFSVSGHISLALGADAQNIGLWPRRDACGDPRAY